MTGTGNNHLRKSMIIGPSCAGFPFFKSTGTQLTSFDQFFRKYRLIIVVKFHNQWRKIANGLNFGGHRQPKDQITTHLWYYGQHYWHQKLPRRRLLAQRFSWLQVVLVQTESKVLRSRKFCQWKSDFEYLKSVRRTLPYTHGRNLNRIEAFELTNFRGNIKFQFLEAWKLSSFYKTMISIFDHFKVYGQCPNRAIGFRFLKIWLFKRFKIKDFGAKHKKIQMHSLFRDDPNSVV